MSTLRRPRPPRIGDVRVGAARFFAGAVGRFARAADFGFDFDFGFDPVFLLVFPFAFDAAFRRRSLTPSRECRMMVFRFGFFMALVPPAAS
ncbi:MAG TPA: hypothetical protein VIZ69_12980 [Thermoanaerobaculia bacterium]